MKKMIVTLSILLPVLAQAQGWSAQSKADALQNSVQEVVEDARNGEFVGNSQLCVSFVQRLVSIKANLIETARSQGQNTQVIQNVRLLNAEIVCRADFVRGEASQKQQR